MLLQALHVVLWICSYISHAIAQKQHKLAPMLLQNVKYEVICDLSNCVISSDLSVTASFGFKVKVLFIGEYLINGAF